MKKYAKLVLASVFLFSMSVMAQDQTPPAVKTTGQKEARQGQRQQMSPQLRAENMAKELSLTDVEKVYRKSMKKTT